MYTCCQLSYKTRVVRQSAGLALTTAGPHSVVPPCILKLGDLCSVVQDWGDPSFSDQLLIPFFHSVPGAPAYAEWSALRKRSLPFDASTGSISKFITVFEETNAGLGRTELHSKLLSCLQGFVDYCSPGKTPEEVYEGIDSRWSPHSSAYDFDQFKLHVVSVTELLIRRACKDPLRATVFSSELFLIPIDIVPTALKASNCL